METVERKGHGEKYSRLKELAIAALLSSPTIKEAADKIGVSESTLRRWLGYPDFRQEYAEEKRHILEAATRDLADAAAEALQSLRNVLKKEWNTSDRIASAKVIRDWHLKQLTLLTMEQRSSVSEREKAHEQKLSVEDVAEEGQDCGDGTEERGADTPDRVPLGQPTFAPGAPASTASPTQVSADGGEKGDGTHAEDRGHESTPKEDPRQATSAKDGDADEVILKPRWGHRPDNGASGASPLTTGSTSAGTQVSADEHHNHRAEERQDTGPLNELDISPGAKLLGDLAEELRARRGQ